jgi:hypothetical protein
VTVGELPLIGDIERRQVVEEFNAPSPAGLTASMPADGGAPYTRCSKRRSRVDQTRWR